MLYNNFVACMMVCAVFALIDMIFEGQWSYIILPIGILVWGCFKFFDANDREFLQRHGINPDEFDAWNPDLYDIVESTSKFGGKPNRWDTSIGEIDRNKNVITWDSPSDTRRTQDTTYGGFFRKRYCDPAYKGIVSKCKRNFKITIDEKEKEESYESEKKRVIHRILTDE